MFQDRVGPNSVRFGGCSVKGGIKGRAKRVELVDGMLTFCPFESQKVDAMTASFVGPTTHVKGFEEMKRGRDGRSKITFVLSLSLPAQTK